MLYTLYFWICLVCSQIFELFHPFKGFITYPYVVIIFPVCSRGKNIYLVFPTFAFRPLSLVTINRASAYFYSVSICFNLMY